MKLSVSVGIILTTSILLSSCWRTEEKMNQTGATQSGITYTSEKIDLTNDSLEDLSSHIYSASGNANIGKYIQELSGAEPATREKRAYLNSFVWNYKDALADKNSLCKENPTECKGEYITLQVWSASDQDGNAIANPNVYLNGEKINATTGISKPEVYKNFVHRVRVEKEGYLDAYSKLNGVEWGFNELTINPKLARADATATLNNREWGVKNAWAMNYTIAPNSFVKENGEPATGEVNVYMFSLDRNDNDLSVFSLDAFGAGWERLGDSFITYGMPYITAYQNGEVLKIDRPIEWTGTILYTEGMNLKGAPKNEWLGRQQLEQFNIPPFWQLDRVNGVWKESQMMLLDDMGTYKFRLL